MGAGVPPAAGHWRCPIPAEGVRVCRACITLHSRSCLLANVVRVPRTVAGRARKVKEGWKERKANDLSAASHATSPAGADNGKKKAQKPNRCLAGCPPNAVKVLAALPTVPFANRHLLCALSCIILAGRYFCQDAA